MNDSKFYKLAILCFLALAAVSSYAQVRSHEAVVNLRPSTFTDSDRPIAAAHDPVGLGVDLSALEKLMGFKLPKFATLLFWGGALAVGWYVFGDKVQAALAVHQTTQPTLSYASPAKPEENADLAWFREFNRRMKELNAGEPVKLLHQITSQPPSLNV